MSLNKSWLPNSYDPSNRPSFTHVSTHQTHVGKALFEHAPNCATIAAVACMSSSLLKSSLGPNLLALIPLENKTFDLFDKIFLEYNPHMQLTQKLVVDSYEDHDKAATFICKLKSNGPLFSSSLQQAEINAHCLRFVKGFRVLRSLTVSGVSQREQLGVLKSLPSLSELQLIGCDNFNAAFFKALGDLENNPYFTSLDISSSGFPSWASESFQKDFCGRLLSKNRLKKLKFPSDFSKLMNEEDEEALVNAGMTNLVEFNNVLPKVIRGEGFRNLRILSVGGTTDENLVNVGNHCMLLEVLEADVIHVTGSFLTNEKLVPSAFKYVRELNLDRAGFSACGSFARLLSLEKLSMRAPGSIDGSCLHHLPNPDRLRTISVSSHNLSVCTLHRFINLEEVDLRHLQLSRASILSFVRFKQIKHISLGYCGAAVAFSEPFQVLCAQLPNLLELCCYGNDTSSWTEEDVEAILMECKCLRVLQFYFCGDGDNNSLTRLTQKYPWVYIRGTLRTKQTAEPESGSRREREE